MSLLNIELAEERIRDRERELARRADESRDLRRSRDTARIRPLRRLLNQR